MTRPSRPFCSDPDAARCFDAWVKRLEDLGLELNPADLYAIGLLASREANLEALRADLATAAPKLRVKLEQAEARAARAFGAALDRGERIFGPRVVETEERHLAAAVGGEGRVLRLVHDHEPRPAMRGQDALAARILAALAGERLTKVELRKRVHGGQSEFLRALKELIEAGSVLREGRGRRGYPATYGLAGS